MARIQVHPEQLRALSAELRRAAVELRAGPERACEAFAGLQFEARRRAGVEAQVVQTRKIARNLAAQAQDLADYLDHKAREFEDADRSQGSFAEQMLAKMQHIHPPVVDGSPGAGADPTGKTVYLAPTIPMPIPVPTPARSPIPTGSIPAPMPAGAIATIPILPVPFKSQWNGHDGGANCGPASIAMALGYFGHDVSTEEVSRFVRVPENQNGDTNFRDQNYQAFLAKDPYHLIQHNVDSLETTLHALDQRQPVLMLVDNAVYIRPDRQGHDIPYPRGMGFEADHIVVVTGYERDAQGQVAAIFINDPLAVKELSNGTYVEDRATGTDFRISIDDFKKAAGNHGWYGSALLHQ